ncbi:transposable element Tcb2 transposase [Trichonephila clavipes]|nr:transposable element Tcb2 transposase [Trichonephila clavipes]
MANNQSVRRHLDVFTRGRIIGKLEEGHSVAAEFGIAHSIVSRLWRQFQTTGTAIRGFSSGRPRGTTPADDRYIVLQARRNRRQTAGEIARHTTQATGRQISRFTVARRLHGGGLLHDALYENLVALHFKYDQARRRFVEWAQNEIAVVPDFNKRILFSNEAHFWLNGYVNKQNCRISSEADLQVYVETPLHPEKLTVWCALWAGGILHQKR